MLIKKLKNYLQIKSINFINILVQKKIDKLK